MEIWMDGWMDQTSEFASEQNAHPKSRDARAQRADLLTPPR